MTTGVARGGMIAGVALVALGLVLLIDPLTGRNPWGVIWPFAVIVPGLLFFVGMIGGGRRAAPLAIPGSIVTTIGVVLFYQNSLGYFQSWAYAWALVAPTAVGAGLLLAGHLGERPRLRAVGGYFAAIGLGLFLGLAAVFEVGVFRSSLAVWIGWPLLLIAFGLAVAAGGLAHTLARREREPQLEFPL